MNTKTNKLTGMRSVSITRELVKLYGTSPQRRFGSDIRETYSNSLFNELMDEKMTDEQLKELKSSIFKLCNLANYATYWIDSRENPNLLFGMTEPITLEKINAVSAVAIKRSKEEAVINIKVPTATFHEFKRRCEFLDSTMRGSLESYIKTIVDDQRIGEQMKNDINLPKKETE